MDEDRLTGWHNRGYLPHLKREGGTYSVTFHLADSLPRAVLDFYRDEREEIVKRAKAMARPLTRAEQDRLTDLYSERIEAYLDAGHGACWLKRPAIAELVAGAVCFFHGERYGLHAWVVMPNHVHAVLTPLEEHSLTSILHSWKSFTSTKANRLLGRRGKRFWRVESYDHLVRDEDDFQRVCQYTEENPVAVGLCRRPEDWRWSSAY